MAYHIHHKRQDGFTLIEVIVSIGILGSITLLLASVFSFSIFSQKEARRQLEAARIGDQIVESLRASSFEGLILTTAADITDVVIEGENGVPIVGKLQGEFLLDMQDRLQKKGLRAIVTIEKFRNRDESKRIVITICEEDKVDEASKPLEETEPGEILVKLSTVVTRRGLNP